MQAVLLASATAAGFVGLRASRTRTHSPSRVGRLRPQRATVFLPWLFDCAMYQGRDDRRRENRLGENHGAGCKEKRQRTEWPPARQYQVSARPTTTGGKPRNASAS